MSSTRPFKHELVRKALHLPALVFPAIALYSLPAAVAILGALMAFYVTLVFLTQRSPSHSSFIKDWLEVLKRSKDADPGPAYLALSLIICLWFFKAEDVFYGAFIMAFCDSTAALVGLKYGRHSIAKLSKTWEGSLAFWILGFLGGLFFLPPLESSLAASMLTVVEMLAIRGTDNFFLPIVAQLLILIFRS